jgi:hypothetical protein
MESVRNEADAFCTLLLVGHTTDLDCRGLIPIEKGGETAKVISALFLYNHFPGRDGTQ